MSEASDFFEYVHAKATQEGFHNGVVAIVVPLRENLIAWTLFRDGELLSTGVGTRELMQMAIAAYETKH
jgi:hypothetical protein